MCPYFQVFFWGGAFSRVTYYLSGLRYAAPCAEYSSDLCGADQVFASTYQDSKNEISAHLWNNSIRKLAGFAVRRGWPT